MLYNPASKQVTPAQVAQQLLATQYDESNGWAQFKEQMNAYKQQLQEIELAKSNFVEQQTKQYQQDSFANTINQRQNKFTPESKQFSQEQFNPGINPTQLLQKNLQFTQQYQEQEKINQNIWHQNFNATFNDTHANKNFYFNKEQQLPQQQKQQLEAQLYDMKNHYQQNQNYEKPVSNLYPAKQYSDLGFLPSQRPIQDDHFEQIVNIQNQQFSNAAAKGYLGTSAMQQVQYGESNQLMFSELQKQVKNLGGIEDTVSKMEGSLRENEFKYMQSNQKMGEDLIPQMPQNLPYNQFAQQSNFENKRTLSIERSRKQREQNEMFLQNLQK